MKITFPLRVDSFVENAQISHKKNRFDILGVSNTFGNSACHFFSGVTTNKKTNAGVCAHFHCLYLLRMRVKMNHVLQINDCFFVQ